MGVFSKYVCVTRVIFAIRFDTQFLAKSALDFSIPIIEKVQACIVKQLFYLLLS